MGVAPDWIFSFRIKFVGFSVHFWDLSVEGGAGRFVTSWKVIGGVSGRARLSS